MRARVRTRSDHTCFSNERRSDPLSTSPTWMENGPRRTKKDEKDDHDPLSERMNSTSMTISAALRMDPDVPS